MNYSKVQENNWMRNFEKLKKLLTQPQKTWHDIAQETNSVKQIFKEQLLYIALVPVLTSFVSDVIIGVEMFEKTHRKPFYSSLVNSFLYYISILLLITILSIALKIIANLFDLKVNFEKAFKLVNYSFYPILLFSVISLIPGSSFLIAGLIVYSLYVFYIGLPILIKNPEDKSIVFSTLMVGLLIVLTIILVVLMEFLLNSIV